MIANTLSRFLSTTIDQDDPNTTRDINQENELFKTRLEQTLDDGYPVDLLLLQQEKKVAPSNNSSILI